MPTVLKPNNWLCAQGILTFELTAFDVILSIESDAADA